MINIYVKTFAKKKINKIKKRKKIIVIIIINLLNLLGLVVDRLFISSALDNNLFEFFLVTINYYLLMKIV